MYVRVFHLQHCWHWSWTILYCGECPVDCRMFSSTPGLSPLDEMPGAPPLHSCHNQKCLQASVLWGTKSPLVENHWCNLFQKETLVEGKLHKSMNYVYVAYHCILQTTGISRKSHICWLNDKYVVLSRKPWIEDIPTSTCHSLSMSFV